MCPSSEEKVVSLRHWYLSLCMGFQSNQQTRRHPYRVTNNSVAKIQHCSPDDGHMDARNMYKREKINILIRIVNLVGCIYESIPGCTVNKTKNTHTSCMYVGR